MGKVTKERMDDMNQKISSDQGKIIVKPGSSPAEMIQSALAGGGNLDNLEKYIELQERWDATEARKSYNRAMSAFKMEPPKIEKDKTVKYKEVKYNHASLANVVDKITVELSKHGLSASWSTKQKGAITVTCHITHSMGHSEQTTITAPPDTTGSKNAIQAIGSTISYLQRYTLLSALGLATCDQDDDGNASEIEYITDKEAHNICDLLIDVNAKEGPLLKYLGIDSLEKMPKSDYQKAITVIEARKNEPSLNENI